MPVVVMNAKKLYLLYSFLVIFTLALAAVKMVQFAGGVNEGIRLVREGTDPEQSVITKVPAEFYIGNVSNVQVAKQSDSICNNTARLEHEGNGEPLRYFYKDNSENENSILVVPNGFTVVVANVLECESSTFLFFISCVLFSWGMVIVYIIIVLFLYKLFARLKKAIRLEQIFYMPLIKALRILGLLLIVENILELLLIYANGKCAVELLALEGFEVDTILSLDVILGIFGISLLFIAQVFKVGYKIQEEQKLTI